MWLDRFSAHPSASGASTPSIRGYSPARRPQHQQHLSAAAQPNRPTFSPRSSSLSLSLATTPNASTTSLHRQNSSKLDQQHVGSASASTIVDPLEVLYNIIGKHSKEGGAETSTDSAVQAAAGAVDQKPECLVEDIDFGELSLEEFVQQQQQKKKKKLKRHVDVQTIEQYEKERDRFQDLHGAIAGCDDVLKSVESYLSRFQTDLGVVSAEIESLQSRSALLNSQLENRRNLERLLGPAVEEVSISPKAVRLISEGPINQEWVKALNEVETRSANIEATTTTANHVKAVDDIKPLLSDLKDKATERIRDYLVAQIKAFRSPNINAQIIQQQSLIKYKDLYGFLSRNHTALAGEISQAYINTMRWYYLSNFTRYHQALEKLRVHSAERNDLLAGDPSSQKGSNIFPGGRNPSYDPFALGRRMDILKSTNHTALPSYLAEENASHTSTNAHNNLKTQQPVIHGIETPFRNFNLALIDNISAEYSLVTEMFGTKTQSLHTSSRRVIEMFEPVFALGHSLTKHLIDNSTDCLGILLCVRLNQHFAFELQRRKVPVADSYINGINMLLWPRFQIVMDLHTESIKRVAAATTTGSSLSFSDTTNANANANANKQSSSSSSSSSSSAPHFLTQRFGQFLQGILALSSEAGDDEPVSNSLARLRTEFDVLLVKLAKAANGGDAKGRERFLWSNYSLVGTIISDTRGKLAEEVKEVRLSMLLPVPGPRPLTFAIQTTNTIRCTCRSKREGRRLFSTSIATNADFTHAIIGGGVVGLSIARHLSIARPNTSTIILERHAAVGTETSSRNSEVIHAGLYYPPASLKTQLCIRGKHLLYDLCASPNHDIPNRRTSKWILAQDAEQLERLQRMHEHAAALGVPTRFLGREEMSRREPDVTARAGVLESPSTGIVDSHALMACLQAEFEERGGDIAFLTAVSQIERVGAGGGYKIYTRSVGTGREARGSEEEGEEATITAETVINAAGHNACAISNMLLPPDRHVRPAYAKGTYFSYTASSPKPRTLLYPAPKPGLGGLGTHLTLDMTGQVRFGPDVEWVDGPDDLVPSMGRLEEAVREIREYLPGVRPEAIGLDYCGVRPKLAGKEGEDRGAFKDFVVREEEGFEGFVNLLGIESPGLTSALAIGERVEGLLYGVDGFVVKGA
ncbi:hypothetical protein AJ78_04215 [Emergomyces pasteurianus Ep9510]|uniref:FAD dependent oxidoreductase domain-containing protein n=1 Tax=Emergomyces pasteurianus Ep9510 TaxID=1447872 RepID=A0A1J9QH76_9EURO|nr:hypothetical protein AJ78_04215 [Emergomyces pasteurianus Ep9510]